RRSVEFVSDVNSDQVDKPNQKKREKVGVEKEERMKGEFLLLQYLEYLSSRHQSVTEEISSISVWPSLFRAAIVLSITLL
uniref:Uncharacterized protein n=1 Tax=Romanomermis culicivorax TaxID=13658 RepID=A0A915IQR3_ROMCU